MKKFKFYMIWVIFILPLVGSLILYYFPHHFHFHTTNRGQLVNPPISVSYLNKENQKKWRIIYIYDGDCKEQCQKISYQLSQLQKALGKDGKRIVISVIPNNSQLNVLQNDFSKSGNTFDIKNKIYLADPLNFLFMYYPSNVNKMNILKDMKKVLEVSQIG